MGESPTPEIRPDPVAQTSEPVIREEGMEDQEPEEGNAALPEAQQADSGEAVQINADAPEVEPMA